MEALLTTKAALLQALRSGPGYGRELMRRLSERAPGIVDPKPGSVYPALGSLVRKGYIRSWKVVPGGHRGGRSRTYYELTMKGVRVSESQRRLLARLAGPAPAAAPADGIERMRERVRDGAELSAFGVELRRALLAAQRRRA